MTLDARLRQQLELVGAKPEWRRLFVWQRPPELLVDEHWAAWNYLPEPDDAGGAHNDRFGFPELPLPPEHSEGRFALFEFLALSDAEPPQIAKFISKWGPLYLCRHNMPSTHAPTAGRYRRRRGLFCAYVFGDGRTYGRERVSAIRAWARMGRAILSIRTALAHSSGLGHGEDWKALSVARVPRTRDEAHARLEGHLSLWMALGMVRPFVALDAAPHYRLTGYGIFGTVAFELGRAAVGAPAALCAACGAAFDLNVPPRRGEDSYCAEKRCKKVRNARDARASRLRLRSKRGSAGRRPSIR